jgi:hypothetical protein
VLRDRVLHRRDLVSVGIAADEEELLRATVAQVVEQDASRGLAVASGAARLLVIRLQVAGHLCVNHEADVRLVHAEAERVRRDHHARVAAHERVLAFVTLARAELAVIAQDRYVRSRERVVQRLEAAQRGDVHDAGTGQRSHEIEDLRHALVFAADVIDAVMKVGPVHRGLDQFHRRPRQRSADVVGHGVGGGRREREHGRIAQRRERVRDVEERRAEIVAPLADAVRLVDDHPRNRRSLERAQRIGIGETLGCYERDLHLAGDHIAERFPARGVAERAVDLRDRYPRLGQRIRLVLHQRDQRRDDERHAGQVQRRQLVAQRLACAGRHDRERIAPRDHGANHVLLAGTQAPDAEHVAQRAPQRRVVDSLAGVLPSCRSPGRARHPRPPTLSSRPPRSNTGTSAVRGGRSSSASVASSRCPSWPACAGR